MKKVLGFLASLAIIFVIIGIFIVNKKPQQDAVKSTNSSSATSTAEAQPTAESAPSQTFNLGEEFKMGDLTVTVAGYDVQQKVTVLDGTATTSADDGQKYIIVSVSVTNSGKNDVTFISSTGGYFSQSYRAELHFGDGYEYSAVRNLYLEEDMHGKEVQPLGTVTGVILFTVPDAVAESTDPLTLHLENKDYKANVALR